MAIAAYIRVSTVGQNEAGQRREIERWLAGNGLTDVRWFLDRKTGDHLDRPGFQQLQVAAFNGELEAVIVWKLDRLSRSLRDGINVLADWLDRGIRLVSVTQQLDFSGAAGRMLAALLLGLGELEQQTRRERQAAGIAAARAAGRRWGGRKKGQRVRVTPEKAQAIVTMHAAGQPIAHIAKAVNLSRPSVYAVLRDSCPPPAGA